MGEDADPNWHFWSHYLNPFSCCSHGWSDHHFNKGWAISFPVGCVLGTIEAIHMLAPITAVPVPPCLTHLIIFPSWHLPKVIVGVFGATIPAHPKEKILVLLNLVQN